MSKIEELRALRERGQGGIRSDKREKAKAALKKAERKAKKGKRRG